MAMLRSLSFVTSWFALLFNLLPTPFAKTGFAVAMLRSLDCFATSPSLCKDTFCCDHVQVLGLLYNISPVCKDRFCSGPCICFATFSPPPFYKDRFCCGHAAPHNLSGHEYTGCNRASLGLGVGWGISCSGPCNISPYPFAKTAFVVAMLRSFVFLCNIPPGLATIGFAVAMLKSLAWLALQQFPSPCLLQKQLLLWPWCPRITLLGISTHYPK